MSIINGDSCSIVATSQHCKPFEFVCCVVLWFSEVANCSSLVGDSRFAVFGGEMSEERFGGSIVATCIIIHQLLSAILAYAGDHALYQFF